MTKRRQTKAVQILLTPDEHARFEALRTARGTSMRALVVAKVLGDAPSLDERVSALEVRIGQLERRW